MNDETNNQPNITPNTNDEKQNTMDGTVKPNKKFLTISGLILALGVLGILIYIFLFPGRGLGTDLKKAQEDAGIQREDTDHKPDIKDLAEFQIEDFPVGFAKWEDYEVNVNPKVASYSVNNNLDGIINKEDFTFSDSAKDLLVKNNFVVVPAKHYEFYPLYEENGYGQKPSFITTDAMLHNYHLMFNHILETLEEEKLAPVLKLLSNKMLSASQAQYTELKGTTWEDAAKRNIGFFTVGYSLLDPDITVPEVVTNEVQKELDLISNHEGIDTSPVMNIGAKSGTMVATPQGPLPLENLKEDYTQYIPRGHYDKSEVLKAYFKSMMWYGRLTFRSKSEDEIKSALLITLALNQDKNNVGWNTLFEPINFFVGKSDDITYYQYNEIMQKIYGDEPLLETVINDQNKFGLFADEVKKLDPPQINSIPIFEAQFQPNREEEISGFRFLGQRFTLDASIFQRLMYREVGAKLQECPTYDYTKTGCLMGARCLPKSLDIPAAMGSKEALNILDAMGETEYTCYPENMSKVTAYISSLDNSTWKQNLYWGWLYSLLPLTEQKPAGYPSFMSSQAWQRKELNTFLGSWTELKHDTILYAKQAYAELGGGPVEEKDYRGYVEPNPYVYSRLASLIKMTIDGLESRQILDEKIKTQLEIMQKLSLSLKEISEKELNNETLTDEEHMLIKSFGGQMEHIWSDVFEGNILSDENSAPLVADVATDPNGFVLEEATGYIYEIYVIVPVEDTLRIARGGVYSYYEFSWPMNDRLTDTKWKQMLSSNEQPDLPEWTNSFISR